MENKEMTIKRLEELKHQLEISILNAITVFEYNSTIGISGLDLTKNETNIISVKVIIEL